MEPSTLLRRSGCRPAWLTALLVTGFAGAQPMNAPSPGRTDMVVVKQRLSERISGPETAAAIERLLATQEPDGTWPDIDYADGGRARWAPAGHIGRVLSLARAYASKTLPDQSERILNAVGLALRHWYTKDYKCPNWWYNVIGVPRLLYRALLLVETELPRELVEQGLPILERARLGMTGQNLVWVAEVTIARGCLAGDPEVVGTAFDRILNEIEIKSHEGIQADFSFWQHGNQLYSGGYGRGFSTDCPHFAALAHGTSFAFPAETVSLLSSYVLDGQQWMVRGGTFDYSACGREITRRGGGRAGSLYGACRDMASLGTARTDEFLAFAARLRPEPGTAPEPLGGHRHFWRSDFSVCHRREFYASVRMTSKRLRQTEICNNENLLGRHLADGVNYLMRRGDEYRGIFPLWDWKRLPGITVELDGKPPKTRASTGEKTFVGGVSDGLLGVSAMDFARGPLTARKAWFFMGNAWVCLGSGISCTSTHPAITSVNQCWLRGDVSVRLGGETRVLDRGARTLTDVEAIHHDGFVYVPGPGQSLTVSNDTQRGNWKRINGNDTDAEVTGEVFSLSLEHGKSPKQAAYAYTIAPGEDPAAGQDSGGKLPRILCQSPVLQAVWSDADSAAGIVFWEPGSVDVPGLGPVGVDTPCIVLVRHTAGKLEVSAANPEMNGGVLHLTCGSRLSGPDARWDPEAGLSTVTLQLPGGLGTGKTVSVSF